MEDIPDDELTTILEQRYGRGGGGGSVDSGASRRSVHSWPLNSTVHPPSIHGPTHPRSCAIAPSYAAKLVAVQRELQRRRSASNVFAGRHGFITPRDLFRWAGRGAVGYQQLAEDGFAVLGERLRGPEEREVVAEVLHKVLGVRLDMGDAYQRRGDAPLQQLRAALEADAAAAAAAATTGDAPAQPATAQGTPAQQQRHSHSMADVAALRIALGGMVWTASMRRM